jgi:hypothetical protein
MDGAYLELEFTHDDGTILNVLHGDGYTRITGGGMDYRGYLDTYSLIDVAVGASHGPTTYVKLARDERAAADYFEVVRREGELPGYSRDGLSPRAASLCMTSHCRRTRSRRCTSALTRRVRSASADHKRQAATERAGLPHSMVLACANVRQCLLRADPAPEP